jgi:hypothetical protein
MVAVSRLIIQRTVHRFVAFSCHPQYQCKHDNQPNKCTSRHILIDYLFLLCLRLLWRTIIVFATATQTRKGGVIELWVFVSKNHAATAAMILETADGWFQELGSKCFSSGCQ